MNIPSGSSVSINNNEVFVDGKPVSLDGFGNEKTFNIVINGNVDLVSGEAATVTVHGDAGAVKTMSGSVDVSGDTKGSISTMSGSVRVAGEVHGAVTSMSGNVRR